MKPKIRIRTQSVVMFCSAVTFMLGTAAPLTAPSVAAAPATPAKVPVTAFHDAMRKLWEDHITWTRLYIVSVASSLPDKDATTARLLQNQADIGNAVKPYYGTAAGDKLTALLKAHILGAAAILDAAKAGDKAKQSSATAAWFANADDIAAFLNKANPTYWPLATVKNQMHMHLNATLEEATARLQGNYTAGVAAYDKVHLCILQLADILSSGIVHQFPDRFSTAQM